MRATIRPAVATVVLLVLAVAVPALAQPPAGTLAAQLVAPGKLTVCVSILGSLAAEKDSSGSWSGYDIDFANDIAGKLGLHAEFAETAFTDLLDKVQSHACDTSISSQNITATRLARVDFVPYTRAAQRILVAKGNPRKVNELRDLCGLLVSTTEGSIFGDMIQGTGDFNGHGLSQACVATGDLPIEVETFPDQQAAVQALLDGTVSAHLGNPNYAYDYPDQLEQSQALLPFARQGIGVAKDHADLEAGISSALTALIDDGTYHDILFKYLGDEKSVAVGTIETPGPDGSGGSPLPTATSQ
jgi:polar amino acid transport system substrate-binding protein